MKPDLDYTKRLLDAFEASEEPFTTFLKLQSHGIDTDDPMYLFHLRLLDDRGLVVSTGRVTNLGVTVGHGGVVMAPVPLRLTADGHDFAAALRQPKVLEPLKEVARQAGMGAAIDTAKSMMIHFATTLPSVLTAMAASGAG